MDGKENRPSGNATAARILDYLPGDSVGLPRLRSALRGPQSGVFPPARADPGLVPRGGACVLVSPDTGGPLRRNFMRRAVTCLVTVGVRQAGPRDIKEIMAACRDSTNLVNLVASCRKRVVPVGCLVICDPIQPHTREEVVRLYVGVDRKTAQS